MIYTVTLNPAIDVILKLNEPCSVGGINRAKSECVAIGGKGINVSRVLNTLKRDSIALGLIGGHMGEIVENNLHKEGIKTDFAKINGDTRVNVKVQYQSNPLEETQFNAPGPEISRDDIMNLVKKLAKIKKDDIVIISGGIPKALTVNLFDNILKFIATKKAYFVLDLYGSYLLKALHYKPFLLNLNEEELADTLYTQIKNEEDCIRGAKRLLKMGAINVNISRGKEGSIFVNEEMIIKAKPYKGEVKNTVGAGDSLLAGFIDEYLKTKSFDLAIKKGVLVACATVFSNGLAEEKTIEELSKHMK